MLQHTRKIIYDDSETATGFATKAFHLQYVNVEKKHAYLQYMSGVG